MIRHRQRGFTMLEVMFALALLALGLTVLLKSAAGNIVAAKDAQMIGVTTDLARAKMYDLEETLIKDGFNETGLADAEDKCTNFEKFEEEGWPDVEWCAKIEQVELPNWEELQGLGSAKAAAGKGSAGSGAGAGSSNAFNDSALGGMMSMLGGGFAGGSGSANIDNAVGASFVQGQFQMVQEVLKVSIRKVTLTMKWTVMGRARDMEVVAFFTDSASMDKVLSGLGSTDLDDAAGSGSGSGSGSGTAKTPTRSTGTGSAK